MKYAISSVLLLLQIGLYAYQATYGQETVLRNQLTEEPLSTNQFIITFGNSSDHLEGEDIDKLLIVAYRALGSTDHVIELSIANHSSSLNRLHEILRTLQYNGVNAEQILIKTTNPAGSNLEQVSLRLVARPISYANKHDLHNADFYASH